MPRTTLTKIQAPGSYPTAGVVVTFTAYDATNKNDFNMTGDDLLLIRNDHASTAKTFTLNSVADEMGRTRNIAAQSLAAGVTYVVGPFTNKVGWAQTGNKLHFEGEDNNIKFAVIKLT